MKTNKLSKSTWLDSYESDAQSQQTNQPSGHYSNREAVGGADCASNDASYCHDSLYDKCPSDVTTDHMTGGTPASSVSAPVADDYFGYKSTAKKPSQTEAQLESPTVRVGSPATVDYEGFENENEKED